MTLNIGVVDTIANLTVMIKNVFKQQISKSVKYLCSKVSIQTDLITPLLKNSGATLLTLMGNVFGTNSFTKVVFVDISKNGAGGSTKELGNIEFKKTICF